MHKNSGPLTDVSILIVNYKTCELTLHTIHSVHRSETQFEYEIILVDNASEDGIAEQVFHSYPYVRVIENEQNVGFAKANNQAMQLATGRYLLLLNSDTIIQPDTLQTMITFMDNQPTIGASGCKIILPNGELDRACRRGFPTPGASFFYISNLYKLFPHNPKFNGYQMGHLNPNESYPIDCLVGAFMLVRREALEQVGGLDEDFFMYGEDIDWCYRIKEAGWGIYYNAETYITHYKGASSRKKPYKIVYEFHRAMWLFHKKHYINMYPLLVNELVFVGIGLKLVVSLGINALKRLR